MFNTLDEEIENVEGKSPTQVNRLVRFLVIGAISVILFGGLFLGVWLLEY